MFKLLFSVVLIISCAFAAEPMISDTAVCVSNKVRVPVCSYNPLADMCLSPFPIHQRPPLFLVTLPHGQRIIFLGTTHDFPLKCMLPYALAQDLIEQSAFTFSEIFGTLLGSNGSARVRRSFEYKDIPDFAFVSDGCRAKLREWLFLNGKQMCEEGTLQKSFFDEHTHSILDGAMASIFDENGKWYEKAGIVVGKIRMENCNEHCEDQNECKDDDHPTHLVLKVKENELTLPIGKELHPVALGIVDRFINNTSLYQMPSFGGMDEHLYYMAISRRKEVFALEKEEDRFCDGAMKEFRLSIEESLQSVANYKCSIEDIVKKSQKSQVEVDEAGELDMESYSANSFYSDAIPELLIPSVLERNDLWVSRIMKLDTELFNLAFGYVGRGHLVDLFRKLDTNGCKVSDRLSLADLEEILLDEPAILQEHARLRKVYKLLFY